MKTTPLILSFLALGIANSSAILVWTVGDRDTAGRQAPEIYSINGSNGTTTFVQEGNGPTNTLPGDQFSPAVNQQADDDFYFAGNYANQVDGGAPYATHGIVASTELGIERAITDGDHTTRYHFNFAGSHNAGDIFTVSFAMLDLNDSGTGTGQYDFDMFLNGTNIGSASHTGATIGTEFVSNTFTLADVNGTAGAPDDNYVELISSNPGSTARWSNFDYVRMDVTPVPEPTAPMLILFAAAGMTFIRRRRR